MGLTVKAVECRDCGDIVYSRTQQDFRECTCGNVSVDGGLSYFKYNVAPSANFEVKKIQIDANLNELYDDWNDMNDEFGLIETKEDLPQTVINVGSLNV